MNFFNNHQLQWFHFSEGDLSGINLFLTGPYKNVVYPSGFYDKFMIDDLKTITYLKPPTIFDAGGFMGVSSLLFSKMFGPKAKIITFEPNPFNLKRMTLHFSHNKKLSQNISIYDLALSNKNCVNDFVISSNIDNGDSSTSRLKNDVHVKYTPEELVKKGFYQQKVRSTTLDNFISKYKTTPNILKIDIEGSEHLLLLGSINFLKENSPIIYIEFHSQYCTLICDELLASLGYSGKILYEEEDGRLFVKYSKVNRHISNDKRNYFQAIKLVHQLSFECSNLQQKLEQSERSLNKIANNPIIKSQIIIAQYIKHLFVKPTTNTITSI
jgi:FkbM family methyltransferase